MELRHLGQLLNYFGFGRDKSEKDDACGGQRRARQRPLARDRFRPIAWSLAGRR
jgi:hypothetical protein